jgi:superfamily II DNA or RNA helicase
VKGSTVSFCNIILRSYQDQFIQLIRDAFAEGHNSVMAVLPTGGGKTICFSYIAANAATKGNTTFILVHRKELVRQTSRSLSRNGIAHGVIAAGYPLTDLPIQVCSVQTLVRKTHLFNQPDLIITDEGHRSTGQTYGMIYRWAPDAAKLAVTATPIRTDGRGFDGHYTILVQGDGPGDLMNAGWLSKPVMYAPPIPEIDLSSVHHLAGDYNRSELDEAMDKQTITGSAVEHYKKLLPNSPPTVAFCVSIKHAEHVAAEFRANGISAESIDGSMDDNQREAILGRLASGETKILTSCDLISEGFDLPAIACAILLRPTKSLALYLQQCGRALRPSADKAETLILDHVQNWKTHGLIEEPRQWTLEGRTKKSKKEKGANLATCPKCYSVFPPAPICPACGENLKPEGAGNGREIEEVDGELVKLDTAAILTFRATGANGGRKKQVITKLQRAK